MTVPMDGHAHFRDEDTLRKVVPITAQHFDIAVAMPNLTPPITTAGAAAAYCQRISEVARSVNPHFKPLGIAYLTDNMHPDALRAGWQTAEGERIFYAAKLYPAGATTNSDEGVTALTNIYSKLQVMQEIGMPLLVHGEVPVMEGIKIPSWDREKIFVETHLVDILENFPRLKVVLEHVSTKEGVDMVLKDTSGMLAATITPHHVLHNANDLTQGGFRAHAYCMPILKSEADRVAIRCAMLSGDARFFAGTDSAPHFRTKKEAVCCAAGAFVAPRALEAYALAFGEDAFNEPDGVTRFERFMSLNGPAFYGIPPSCRKITLVLTDDVPLASATEFALHNNATIDHLVPFFSADSGMYPKDFKFPWRAIRED
jgi:dihydroorotase